MRRVFVMSVILTTLVKCHERTFDLPYYFGRLQAQRNQKPPKRQYLHVHAGIKTTKTSVHDMAKRVTIRGVSIELSS